MPEFVFRIHDGIKQQYLELDLPDEASALRELDRADGDIVQNILARRMPSVELSVELHHADQVVASILVNLKSSGRHQDEQEASPPDHGR